MLQKLVGVVSIICCGCYKIRVYQWRYKDVGSVFCEYFKNFKLNFNAAKKVCMLNV